MFGIILIALAAILYFLPIFVAGARDCKAISGIGVVNVFLGWTFIGWVVALAWAASGETTATADPNPQEPPMNEAEIQRLKRLGIVIEKPAIDTAISGPTNS